MYPPTDLLQSVHRFSLANLFDGMEAALPLRVCVQGGAYRTIRIGPRAASIDVERAIALAVRLPVGTFGLENDTGVSTTIDADLTGDWTAVPLPTASGG